MKSAIRRSAVAVSIAAVLTLGVAPAAIAAPASDAAGQTPTISAVAGDGVWAPSHDEALALIPVCSGPLATLKWLNANFADHGTDIASALRRNVAMLTAILTFTAKPYDVLQLLFQDILQVPVYTVNDVVFHQVPTVKDILTFCSSTRR
ncbi:MULTISPECIES: hypothetical protein [unclassified Rhodococcus (in: high G+C Gram-positive bacteria)]|uniref:hypothetical protein n=1 Tax=unclassified Rhodococcus (in: high G+C Gram-positive bacteria) TaxID=192944 RepID=UPI0029554614|nr:hypothetical protein [Rhodococcus sp. IEGM 1318]MDV8006924.1 hypothetical protein [Rhodococcus sp. IEGM 1318]MDZ7917254.1 hypothetical protein [Rhodococcus sp. (in: high G+C Gram-positive bacteria)]